MSGEPAVTPLRRSPEHLDWLRGEATRLAALTAAAEVERGFGYLDEQCRVTDAPVQTWITCRMTHVAGLAVLAGLSADAMDYSGLAAHGVRALAEHLRDTTYGGWFAAVGPDGTAPMGEEKEAYPHAFVVLAGATATAAGVAGGEDLLSQALDVLLGRFWDPAAQMMVESWDRAFAHLDDYRGVNANMHSVEALLAAGSVTGDAGLTDRARAIADRVARLAAANDWRIPEHFDGRWTPLLDYHHDLPADPFRPYGATIGHGLEWARLLVQVGVATGSVRERLSAAAALYDRAVADGWAADGAPGFVYTTDWEGRPVTRARMHWVCCEAIASAATLAEAGEDRFERDYERWWDYAWRYLLDEQHGSWHHELDADNRPAAATWPGKPDLYHAVQACLLPPRPLVPSAADAARVGEP